MMRLNLSEASSMLIEPSHGKRNPSFVLLVILQMRQCRHQDLKKNCLISVARGKSSIAPKPEDHPKIYQW